MKEIQRWAADLLAEKERRAARRGGRGVTRRLVLAWALVEQVSSSGLQVRVRPYGATETRQLDGWLTTPDPRTPVSRFVQIGGPRLERGDTALVMLHGGYLIAIGRRSVFTRRDRKGTRLEGDAFLLATPTRDGGRLTWGYTPGPGEETPRISAWELVHPNGSQRYEPGVTSATLTGYQPSTTIAASIIMDGETRDGTPIQRIADAVWTTLAPEPGPDDPDTAPDPLPTVTITARATGPTSVRVSYTVSGITTGWRLTADGERVASGGGVTSGVYDHTGLQPGSEHTYRIEADYAASGAGDLRRGAGKVDAAATATTGRITIDSFTVTRDVDIVNVAWTTTNPPSVTIERREQGSTGAWTTVVSEADEDGRVSDTPGAGDWDYRIVVPGAETRTSQVSVPDPDEPEVPVPPPTVRIVAATATLTTVTVRWETTGGTLTGQTFTWWPTDSPTDVTRIPISVTSRMQVIPDLPPGSRFTVRVAVTTSAGSDSAETVATTGTLAPPNNVQVVAGNNSVTVTATTPVGVRAEARIRSVGIGSWGGWRTLTDDKLTFPNLQPGTPHEVQVRAVQGDVRSNAVTRQTETTSVELATPVVTVSNPRYVPGGSETGEDELLADVTWTGEPATGVLQRQISITSTSPRTTDNWQPLPPPRTAGRALIRSDDLRTAAAWPWFPGRRAWVRVRYRTADGWSGWGESDVFQHSAPQVAPPYFVEPGGVGRLSLNVGPTPSPQWTLRAFRAQPGSATQRRLRRRTEWQIRGPDNYARDGNFVAESSQLLYVPYPRAGDYTISGINAANRGALPSERVTARTVNVPRDFSALSQPPWFDIVPARPLLQRIGTVQRREWYAAFRQRFERIPADVDGIETSIAMTANPNISAAALTGSDVDIARNLFRTSLGVGVGIAAFGSSALLAGGAVSVSLLSISAVGGGAAAVTVGATITVGFGGIASPIAVTLAGPAAGVLGGVGGVSVGAGTLSTVIAASGALPLLAAAGLTVAPILILGILQNPAGQGSWTYRRGTHYPRSGGNATMSVSHEPVFYRFAPRDATYSYWTAIMFSRYFIEYSGRRYYSPGSYRLITVNRGTGTDWANAPVPVGQPRWRPRGREQPLPPTGTRVAKTALFVPVFALPE